MTNQTQAGGIYFDGRSSRDHAATLVWTEQEVTLTVPELDRIQRWSPTEVRIDPPLPGVRRVLKFPDGSRFETNDAVVGSWERRAGRNRLGSQVRRLEGRWAAALSALALAVVALALFVVYGLPAAARQAARVTPVSVLATFDRETMELLDGTYLSPTRLSPARQAGLRREFSRVTAWAGGPYPYRLLFRRGEPEAGEDGAGASGGMGPNAFALPNGTVVMTDELVALARDDRELIGVLAHEAAHVTGRHGLSAVYQALGLTLVTTVVTGDLVSASTFAAAVPAAILRGGYSRAAETEADDRAGAYLMQEYGTTRPLREMLGRLERQLGGPGGEGDGEEGGDSSLLDLLNSHPGTPQRVAHLERLEQAGR